MTRLRERLAWLEGRRGAPSEPAVILVPWGLDDADADAFVEAEAERIGRPCLVLPAVAPTVEAWAAEAIRQQAELTRDGP